MAHYGIPCRHSGIDSAEGIMIGSIAKFAKPGMAVMGSGFIRESDPVCADANYMWVRGPMTRRKVLEAGGKCPKIYGDAAMFLPEIFPASRKQHKVGIVPHHVDYDAVRRMGTGLPVINLLNPDVKAVTDAITSCRYIISSSLHGIIVAHAYGIPAAWVQFSDKLKGDGFKFRDHYAALGLEAVPSTMRKPVYSLGTLDMGPAKEALLCCR
jgi:hypothetical protein